jgi:hypothetical protein
MPAPNKDKYPERYKLFCERISKSMKGKILRPRSEEHKKNLSKSLKGIKIGPQSEEHKKKISEGMKGINKGRKIGPSSTETRKKQSEALKGKYMGPESSQWRGGISCEPYCDVWLDKDFKDSIKERDENKCLNPDCWSNTKRLSLHHINYNKKDCKLTNLITLCISCNGRANKDRDWHQSWYQTILYRKYGYEYKC